MILELALALIIGVLAGTLTGLSPGIHINLVAALLLSSIDKFQSLPLISLAVFITSMSITHTFIDFIPSIFLGAPEEDTFLSILPGHRLLKEGLGLEAITLCFYGCLFSIIPILFFTFIFLLFLPQFFNIIKEIIPFILIFISIYLIARESSFLKATIVFILSGILGYLTFNLPVEQPLVPLLTGLFGLSGLLISVKASSKLNPQKKISFLKTKLSFRELKSSILAAFISIPFCSFLPGIGSGHAAVIGSEIIPQNDRSFLFLNGCLNTTIMALSFITAYVIGKTRTGSAATISQLIPNLTTNDIAIILLAVIISSFLAFIVGINISKIFSKIVSLIPYKTLNILIIIILFIVNIILSNWLGLIVLLASTFLGIYCISSGIRRINLMGCLLIPSIIYYLF